MTQKRVPKSFLGLLKLNASMSTRTDAILKRALRSSSQYCRWSTRSATSGDRKYATKAAKSTKAMTPLFRQTATDVGDEVAREHVYQEKQALKKTAKNCDRTRKRRKWGLSLLAPCLLSLSLWAIYKLGQPDVDEVGDAIEDEYTDISMAAQHLLRAWKSVNFYCKMLQDPTQAKLLPDPLKPPYEQPPYTLVLELNDVLVHPDWTYHTGWRYKKRPGVDDFLQKCAQHFEIVIYTAETGTIAFPVLDELDPDDYIRYRLVREATQLVDGQHVKDLQRLNRDLKKLIYVDWNPNSTTSNADNALNIVRWTGDNDDAQLCDLMSLLESLVADKVDDVRDVLRYYRQFEDPLEEFKEKQRALSKPVEAEKVEEVQWTSKQILTELLERVM